MTASRRTLQNIESFCAHVGIERMLGAANQDLRLDTDLAQLGDDCCVGLVFSSPGRLDERHERDVHDDDVVAADLEGELADGLEKRADPRCRRSVPPISVMTTSPCPDRAELRMRRLDLVGDVRDDLDGLAEVIAAALLSSTLS